MLLAESALRLCCCCMLLCRECHFWKLRKAASSCTKAAFAQVETVELLEPEENEGPPAWSGVWTLDKGCSEKYENILKDRTELLRQMLWIEKCSERLTFIGHGRELFDPKSCRCKNVSKLQIE